MSDEVNSGLLGVYLSVPFCRAKCSFCNFASGVGGAGDIEAYVEKLCGEIAGVGEFARELGAELPRRADSVYFGGGTPSLLRAEQLGQVFGALRAEFDVVDGAEITLEAAPGQMEDAVLLEAMRLGVNRVSLGVQTFVDRESQAVGRSHTEVECVAEVRRLRAAGVAEVGVDLIAGLPYQTRESWEYSLRVACELAAEGSLTHLSVYMFEVDEDSRLGREVLGGGLRLHAPKVPGEEVAAELYELACERLVAGGFRQYEISNFAWGGGLHESRHNRRYWERGAYVGFGLDAHSMLLTRGGVVRFANADELAGYGIWEREVTRVGERDALEERVFLGLRMCEGLRVDDLPGGFVRELRAPVAELVEGGFLVERDGRWSLTRRGRVVSNEVFGRLLECVAV